MYLLVWHISSLDIHIVIHYKSTSSTQFLVYQRLSTTICHPAGWVVGNHYGFTYLVSIIECACFRCGVGSQSEIPSHSRLPNDST